MDQGILVPIGDTFVVVREPDRRLAAEQVLDLLAEARKRGLSVTLPSRPIDLTPTPSGAPPMPPVVDFPPSWRAFLALLESGPQQAMQTRLLHLLRERPGQFVERAVLVKELHIPFDEDKPARVNNVLGGIVTALIRKSRKVGFNDADVIERSGNGYRAGRFVLKHPLPTVEESEPM